MRRTVNFTSYGVNATSRLRSIPTPFLGGGYSDDRQMAVQLDCYAPGNVTFIGSGKSTIYFSNAVSFTDLQQTLNVDLSASTKIGVFSAEISASYLHYVEEKHYTQTVYYIETISLPTQDWQPLGVNISALTALGQGNYKAGLQQFRKVCGNKIAQQVKLGANLIVTLLLDFASYYDKQVFTQHVSASWGSLLSASATITQIVTQYKIKGYLDFSAYQLAGDPTQLAKIFGSEHADYYVARCALTNLEACKSVIDGVITYAQNNFPEQIDFKDGKVLGYAAPIGYTWMEITDLELDEGVTVINATVEAARKKLGDIYRNQTADSDFVNHLLGSPFAGYMYTAAINSLRVNKNNLDTNIQLLADQNNGAIGCYFYPERCPSILQSLQLQPVDAAFINGMNTGWIVSGDLSYCTCVGGCGGAKVNIDVQLFALDNSSSAYASTIAPDVAAHTTIASGVLSLAVSDGGVCRTAYKDAAYNQYNFNPCAPNQNLGCIVPLGGQENGWLCAAEICNGMFVFKPTDSLL